MTDKKALQILFDTYWSSEGWKRESSVSPEKYEHARTAGLMFEPINASHDDVTNWLNASLNAVKPENIANAFLISLNSRQLELRSALGSFAIAKNFPNHAYQGSGYGCSTCGTLKNTKKPYDLSMFNFERYKWGGVRHERPEYIAFDLEQFAKLDLAKATEKDIEVLRQIIQVVKGCNPTDGPRDLEKKLAPVLRSNKAEREILVQILAYCGILHQTEHSGYFQSFTNFGEREVPPASKLDWTYPACWWRGADGINYNALYYYFPQLAKGG